MVTVRSDIRTALITELQRRVVDKKTDGAELMQRLRESPDEYVLVSNGNGTVSALRPARDGRAAPEAVQARRACSRSRGVPRTSRSAASASTSSC
jgi:hypothetical protein